MANNAQQTVEDVEEKRIDPSPDSPEDEFMPLAPAPGGTENPPDSSVIETKPGEQPAAEPAPKEPEKAAEGEAPKPAQAVSDKDDVSLLAESLKNLSTEYKRLDSETPIEYARRLEIIRLRKDNRSKKAGDLLGNEVKQNVETPAPASASIEANTDEDIDPEEIARFDRIAKKSGYVKASEVQANTYQEKAKMVFDSWLESHPHYDEVHDPDGLLWERLKKEFNSGLYNTKPPEPSALKTILDKIDQDIFGIQPTSNLAQVKAQQEKIKVVSHSGSSPSGAAPAPEDSSVSAKKSLLKRGLKGFSDEEIDELLKD